MRWHIEIHCVTVATPPSETYVSEVLQMKLTKNGGDLMKC